MQLQLATWPEVEAYLTRSQGIIMPIGSTEQHGPNGLVGTDAICAEEVAKGVGERTGAMVAPTISVGMAQHHLGFPGSMTLRPSTLIAVVRDMVESLAVHGFRRFFFLNGHGGNIATLTAAFSEIYAGASLAPVNGNIVNAPAIRCRLKNWWEAKPVATLSRELYGRAEGSHATPSEVSLTWAAYPEAARPMTLDPEIAPKGEFTDAADYRRRFPDGRIGSNPGLSSVEAGRRILEAAIDGMAAEYESWIKDS
jgi:creatinine amidohydrolase